MLIVIALNRSIILNYDVFYPAKIHQITDDE